MHYIIRTERKKYMIPSTQIVTFKVEIAHKTYILHIYIERNNSLHHKVDIIDNI